MPAHQTATTEGIRVAALHNVQAHCILIRHCCKAAKIQLDGKLNTQTGPTGLMSRIGLI
jgi:hypothetical protein